MGRTKEQWIAKTGGFRLGESNAQFLARVAEIDRLTKQLKKHPSEELVDKIVALKGLDE